MGEGGNGELLLMGTVSALHSEELWRLVAQPNLINTTGQVKNG